MQSRSEQILKGCTRTPFISCLLIGSYNRYAQSEILGLRWKDIDLENETLKQRRSATSYSIKLIALYNGSFSYDDSVHADKTLFFAWNPSVNL
jgi:integrase